jgi:hypothetical protein
MKNSGLSCIFVKLDYSSISLYSKEKMFTYTLHNFNCFQSTKIITLMNSKNLIDILDAFVNVSRGRNGLKSGILITIMTNKNS